MDTLRHLDWGSLYVASEWAIRIGAFLYVPQRRPPNAARAWLLLIFFLPWAGLVLYSLIGRAYLPRRRFEVQKQIAELVRRIAPRSAALTTALAGESTASSRSAKRTCDDPARSLRTLAAELVPAVRLADRLSEFPLTSGNAFTLLPHYDAALERILDEIAGARRYVHMLFYIFENDEVGARVTDALVAAARRGIAVRVLMDAIGSRAGLAHLGPRLRAAGAEVVAVMPLRLWGPNAARFDLRNHRKIVVVDGECAFFGSQNVVSAHANRGLVNEELLVRVTGPLVRHLHAVLLGDRYLETGTLPPESDDLSPAPTSRADRGFAQVVPSGPGYNEGTAEAVMIALMYGARSRIVLTSPYVIPSEPFLAAMLAAARRGVQVDLIVDAESNKPLVQLAQQSFYDGMLAAGVGIHRHKRSFLHAKHVSVDDDVALVGSSNLDIRSFALNAEVSVLIHDPDFVRELRHIQDGYLRNSEPVTREGRANLPRGTRVLENLARLTDSLL
ncbi:MAG: PLDc N-terminal domain-containing protein [Burkholderiales bacterium]|nr:PLDc N-terminal domain-containing protein [Burkholderiales bacterium]